MRTGAVKLYNVNKYNKSIIKLVNMTCELYSKSSEVI